MTTNHELEAMLDEAAQAIAQVEPDPANWEPWAVYLFEVLEQIATDNRRKDEFDGTDPNCVTR